MGENRELSLIQPDAPFGRHFVFTSTVMSGSYPDARMVRSPGLDQMGLFENYLRIHSSIHMRNELTKDEWEIYRAILYFVYARMTAQATFKDKKFQALLNGFISDFKVFLVDASELMYYNLIQHHTQNHSTEDYDYLTAVTSFKVPYKEYKPFGQLSGFYQADLDIGEKYSRLLHIVEYEGELRCQNTNLAYGDEEGFQDVELDEINYVSGIEQELCLSNMKLIGVSIYDMNRLRWYIQMLKEFVTTDRHGEPMYWLNMVDPLCTGHDQNYELTTCEGLEEPPTVSTAEDLDVVDEEFVEETEEAVEVETTADQITMN
jgi:hypothetical protein